MTDGKEENIVKRKWIGALLCVCLSASMLSGCGNAVEDVTTGNVEADNMSDADVTDGEEVTSAEQGKVYYLNFKQEVADEWQAVGEAYTKATGVEVTIVTAPSGAYDDMLKAQINKEDAPTLFQINGPVEYKTWKDYTYDLSDTQLYAGLSDKSLAIEGEDGGIYAVPYTIEGYGIIYNDAIMQKYFATEGAVAADMDEINNFDTLKAVVEDMTAKKEELGIEGVFANTSLAAGEDWRWHTHLANIPVYYEFQDKDIDDTAALEFTYADNLKNIFDLYINNSTTAPTLLTAQDVASSMAEFALGQAAMVQNGNWAWSQIAGVDGNVVAEEDCKFLPIYTGIEGEENQGLCIGTENFWCINSHADEADIQATVDFVDWLVTSEEGKAYMVNDLANTAPFMTFSEEEKPGDPLTKSMLDSVESGKTSVNWIFGIFPSQEFKDDFGAALGEYCNGNYSWEDVVYTVITRWAEEKAAAAEK